MKIYVCQRCGWNKHKTENEGLCSTCGDILHVFISEYFLLCAIDKINSMCATAEYAFPDNKKLAQDLCGLINQAFERLKKELTKSDISDIS